MRPSPNMSVSLVRTLILLLTLLLLVAGCGLFARTPVKQPEQPRVDIKAQQLYYDQGLKHYSRENYRAAQESFQKVVDNGPTTTLGLKAQENLKKLQQILKTIENIQAK